MNLWSCKQTATIFRLLLQYTISTICTIIAKQTNQNIINILHFVQKSHIYLLHNRMSRFVFLLAQWMGDRERDLFIIIFSWLNMERSFLAFSAFVIFLHRFSHTTGSSMFSTVHNICIMKPSVQQRRSNTHTKKKKQIERRMVIVRCSYNLCLLLLNKTYWTTDYYDEMETPSLLPLQYPFCTVF